MIKNILITLLLISQLTATAQIQFDDYFVNATLRFDYLQTGNADTGIIAMEQMKREPLWGGSYVNLIDEFGYGDYRYLITDSASDLVIYSRGYSNLFCEWQEIEEAKFRMRSFYESIVFPFPKATVKLSIQDRDRQHRYHTVFEQYINPDDYFISKEAVLQYDTLTIHGNASPQHALDIAILAEGYRAAEMTKFEADARRFVDHFFKVEPFKSNPEKVVFRIVKSPSIDSGTDIPGTGVWKNTIMNTNFYTFDSERYITTTDIKSVRDVAASVPYDQIFILVNSAKYGGGGIYNYYNLCTADHLQSHRVFSHEFGHGFAALADEYAYDDTPPEQFYNLSIEPWQVNLTTLVDFKSKWSDLVKKKTPLPTPNDEKYKNAVGAFEGAGYVKTKVYRPVSDCKMRSNNTDEFCPVCRRAILELLNFYAPQK